MPSSLRDEVHCNAGQRSSPMGSVKLAGHENGAHARRNTESTQRRMAKSNAGVIVSLTSHAVGHDKAMYMLLVLQKLQADKRRSSPSRARSSR